MQLDRDWLLRFDALLDLMRRALWITAALLGAGVIAVVGNTIRLEIKSRAAEIEVTQLVGGSRAFVRRPFLYTGMLYGLIAGALGLRHWSSRRALALNPSVARLAASYGPSFTLAGPTLRELGFAAARGRRARLDRRRPGERPRIARSAPGGGVRSSRPSAELPNARICKLLIRRLF